MSGKPLTKATVLVVHRAGFVRSGALWLIAKSMQFVTCGETDDAPTARELFLRRKPDLVLLGLTLRGGDGIQLIKDFRNLNPAAATVVLSASDDALSVRRAFRAGARGYLSIDDASEMLRAFDEISNGHAYEMGNGKWGQSTNLDRRADLRYSLKVAASLGLRVRYRRTC